MTTFYAPILKAKAGEFKAIRELDERVRSRIAPLFDFDLPDAAKGISQIGHLSKTAIALKKCNPPQRFFIDTFNWAPDAQVETGEHVINFTLSRLREEGLAPIPTIGYDRWGSLDYRLAIANAGSGPNGAWAIRLDRSVLEDMYDPDLIRNTVNEMLAVTNALPENVVLFIDLQDVSSPNFNVQNILQSYSSVLAALGRYGFRAFVIVGSSVPTMINFAVAQPDTNAFVARKEQLAWRALRAAHPLIPIVAGDYGVRGPTSYSGPNKNMNGKVRYSIDSGFFVARGHPISSDGSYVQMHDLAAAVVTSGHFRGPAFSWGDTKIAEAAAGLFTGNMTSWIAVDTSHHMHSVVDEVIGVELAITNLAPLEIA